jgi:hypothetical protein
VSNLATAEASYTVLVKQVARPFKGCFFNSLVADADGSIIVTLDNVNGSDAGIIGDHELVCFTSFVFFQHSFLRKLRGCSFTVSSSVCQFHEKVNVPGCGVHELELGTCKVFELNILSPN